MLWLQSKKSLTGICIHESILSSHQQGKANSDPKSILEENRIGLLTLVNQNYDPLYLNIYMAEAIVPVRFLHNNPTST